MIQYLLLLAFSTTAVAQSAQTIFVTTDTSSSAQHIFSINGPRIVKTVKVGEGQNPAAVVEFSGVMEGNLCTHDQVTLTPSFIDSKWDKTSEQNFYVYSLHTYKNEGRSGINAGGFCSSYSRHSPFRMRVNYNAYIGQPVRTKTWAIKFDLGHYGKEKKYSPVYRIIYSQKDDKWDLKVTAR